MKLRYTTNCNTAHRVWKLWIRDKILNSNTLQDRVKEQWYFEEQ